MECDICHREHEAKKLPFLCAVDARNQIYEARMGNLQLLVQNESLQHQINDLLSQPASRPSSAALDSTIARQQAAADRTDQIIAAADRLRDEIKAARDEIRERKAALARRRSDLSSVADGLSQHRDRQQLEVQKATQTLTWRWNQVMDDFSGVRTFLCTEAAGLYGLERVQADEPGLYQYHIGKVPISDLNKMNSVSPEVISTSLAHISHVLLITCNYLAIRLPAEISLPHRDYPRPTIFNLSGSYNHASVPFQNTAGVSAAATEARLADSQHGPRPRPLFIEKPLPQLSKEDSVAYSFFLEGVSLLAYDIAWLCASQGISVGDKGSFEDICQIGRNLYNLLGLQGRAAKNGSAEPASTKKPAKHHPDDDFRFLGHFSHGTTYDFMGGTPGSDPTKALKLPSPIKLADQLKKVLVGDLPVGDWEVVDDVPKQDDIIDSRQGENQKPGSSKPSPAGGKSPRTGSNGWMRVKNR